VKTKAAVLKEKLEQKPLESKKAIYALFAGVCVLLTFAVSAFLIEIHSEAAKEIVELANMEVMAIMAIAMTAITGQAAFDWKAVSALQHVDEDTNDRVESNQPIGEVDISHGRSPKDFLDESPF
jgi:hypothetical protein